jgi:hypothetical protein
MKKALLSKIALFFTIISFSQSWEYVGNSKFIPDVYEENFNMTVTKDGKPIVYFKEERQSNRGKTRIFNGTNWIPYGPENGFGPGSETELNIETDNDNNIVTVYEAVRGYGQRYTDRYRGLHHSFSQGRTSYLDLAISKKSNHPYVVFSDEYYRSRATVSQYNYTTNLWEIVGSPGFTGFTVRYTTIAIDNNDTPYIVFQDRNESAKISVMKFDGTNWVYVGEPGFINGEARYTSIAINSKNEVYIIYTNKLNGYKAIVKKFDGTNWINLGESQFISDGPSYSNQIKISKNDTPYIAINDVANGGKATVKRFVDNKWEVVGNVGFTNEPAGSLSLQFDDANQLYLGFTEGSNGNIGASVMKFDTTTLPVSKIKFKEDNLEVFPNPTANFIEVKTLKNIKEICVYNILGQQKIKQKIKKINVSNLNSGVYFMAIITLDGKKEIRKFVKN